MRVISRMEEREQMRKNFIKWIAELEEELAQMDDSWGTGNHGKPIPDGARMFAAVFFPGWSPKLDKLRMILSLTKDLYPTGPEVKRAMERVALEKERIAKDRTIVDWPMDRQVAALSNVDAMIRKACK